MQSAFIQNAIIRKRRLFWHCKHEVHCFYCELNVPVWAILTLQHLNNRWKCMCCIRNRRIKKTRHLLNIIIIYMGEHIWYAKKKLLCLIGCDRNGCFSFYFVFRLKWQLKIEQMCLHFEIFGTFQWKWASAHTRVKTKSQREKQNLFASIHCRLCAQL